MNIDILNYFRELVNWKYGYDLFITSRYMGNGQFQNVITNVGAIPVYNVDVEIFKDNELYWKHNFPIIKLDKEYPTKYLNIELDGLPHMYGTQVSVRHSIHKDRKDRYQLFRYVFLKDQELLCIVWDGDGPRYYPFPTKSVKL